MITQWFSELVAKQPVACSVLVLAVIAVCGLGLGQIRVLGIRLGVAGVLFSGIIFGHLHLSLTPTILDFVRDFGLILFVYTIGLQVGPGFFTSLRRNGLALNGMAVAIIVTGATLAVAGARLLKLDMAAAVGIFAGATTNTPSLGAAQEALKQVAGANSEQAGLPALGYAVAYPFGIIGIVLTMLALRAVFRTRSSKELHAFEKEQEQDHPAPQRMNIRIRNRNLHGLKLHDVPGCESLGVVVSRIKRNGDERARVAAGDTILHEGDVILAVGTPAHLHEFCLIVGEETGENLMEAPGPLTFERCVITKNELFGKTVRELHFAEKYNVAVTRVIRGDIEMSAVPHLTLKFGDLLQVVGQPGDVARVAELVGNSVKELNRTNFITMFVGIGLGVLLGLYPASIAGMPMPVRLGMAGGPLVAAILLSRLGRVGPLVWYMPLTANLALRELGITLFLACAGLKAGEHFFEVVCTREGPLWMALGAVVTVAPLFLVSLFGRLVLRLNFIPLCGLLAGSMTDPPALAFANSINKSEAPSVAYATVYPLTMLLRILVAQALVIIFLR